MFWARSDDSKNGTSDDTANAAFIAAARTAVPELLAEKERLRAALSAIACYDELVEGRIEAYGVTVARKFLGIARAALVDEVKP